MIIHNGMRPQDIAVLLKITISENNWQNKDLASSLQLSQSEISYSIQRSAIAGLLDGSKRKVMKSTLLEFIQYGLPYVFPAVKGPVTMGIPTAWSSPFMAEKFKSNEQVVWPYSKGNIRGSGISPLYPGATLAVQTDAGLYQLLSLVDVMRIGKIREKETAIKELERVIKNA